MIGSVISFIGDWLTVITGVPASIILIINAYSRSKTHIKWRKQRKFWDYKNKLVLVSPVYNGNHSRNEDVLSCDILETHLRTKLHVQVKKMGDKYSLPPCNRIVICGPKANTHSKNINDNQSLRRNIGFLNDAFGIVDKRTSRISMSPMDEGINTDFALIGKVQENSDHWTVYIWGIHGIGTLGAASWLVDGGILKELSKDINSEFSVILEVNFDENLKVTSIKPYSSTLIGVDTRI